MSKKLRKRITIVASKDPHKLHSMLTPAALSAEYGGVLGFDRAAYTATLLAAPL